VGAMPGQSAIQDSKFTVYVVEDDEPVRDSLIALLESEGFETVAFSSSEAFLEHFHPEGEACLVLDLELPGKSGLQLLEILGARLHHLPVFVVTGNADLRVRARALDLGAEAVFVKPSDPSLLIETIRQSVC
jgi:two-component system response regulator FixJ